MEILTKREAVDTFRQVSFISFISLISFTCVTCKTNNNSIADHSPTFQTIPNPSILKDHHDGSIKKLQKEFETTILKVYTLFNEYKSSSNNVLNPIFIDAAKLSFEDLKHYIYSHDFERHYLSFHKWQKKAQNLESLQNQLNLSGNDKQNAEDNLHKTIMSENIFELETLPSKCAELKLYQGCEIDPDSDESIKDVKGAIHEAFSVATGKPDTTGGAILLTSGFIGFTTGAIKYQLPSVSNKGFVAMEVAFSLALAYFGYRLITGDHSQFTQQTAAALMIGGGLVAGGGATIMTADGIAYFRGLRSKQTQELIDNKYFKPIYTQLQNQMDLTPRLTSKIIGGALTAGGLGLIGFALYKIFQGTNRLSVLKQMQKDIGLDLVTDPRLEPDFQNLVFLEKQLIIQKKNLLESVLSR